jgi:hypothetical protein
MKKNLQTSVWKCCILTLLFLSILRAEAQYQESSSSMEAGFTIGPTFFLGDLGGNAGKGTKFIKDNNFPATTFHVGAYAAFYPSEFIGFRLALNYGALEGDDQYIKGKGGWEEHRKVRNSNFKSHLAEAMLLTEIYPTVFLEYDRNDLYRKFRPYAAVGVGVFNFNPKGQDPLTGEWVELKPLRTEGQGFPEYPTRKEYSLTQLNIPMGVGVKYFLNERFNVSLEVLHRTTFTDYIDDVSTRYINPAVFYTHMDPATAQLADRMANKSGTGLSRTYTPGMIRGNPNNNDAYFTFNVKLGFKLGAGGGFRNSTDCPIRF